MGSKKLRSKVHNSKGKTDSNRKPKAIKKTKESEPTKYFSGYKLPNLENNQSRIKNLSDIKKLDQRYKKFQLIRKKAEERFDELISIIGVEKDSLRKSIMIPVDGERMIIKETDLYEDSKQLFVNAVYRHFSWNKPILNKVSSGLPLAGDLKDAKVANDITEITEEAIDETINGYVDIIILILGIAPPLHTKLKNEIELLIADKENTIYDLLMKNRTYDIKLFKKAKTIYLNNKKRRPRITHAEALILANHELGIYDELTDKNGFDTLYFTSMQVSFRKAFKKL